MTIHDLYKYYREVHDRAGGGCKSTCGQMTLTCHLPARKWYVQCGTYCIGPGRWEVIGEGDSEEKAIEAAYKQLKAWDGRDS